MKVAPVRVYGRDGYIDTYACLDTAAGQCICTKELVDLLEITGESRQVAVMSATGTTEVSSAQNVTLTLQGYRTQEFFNINAIALENMTDLSEHIPTQADIDRHPHMRGLRIPDHRRKRVDLLICIGESRLQHTYDTRIASEGQLWATNSGLGWVLHGRDSGRNSQDTAGSSSSSNVRVNSVRAACGSREDSPPVGEAEILSKVRTTFAIDFSEPQHCSQKLMSRTDCRMLAKQQASFKISDGRCEVAKLWRKSPVTLPNNRGVAIQSLKRLARRLLSDDELLQQYQEFFRKMLAEDQADIPADLLGLKPGYFLLHHPVLTKFRVVFNGAASFKGQCLNDFLDKGPEHTSSLLGVLLRFCKDKYAVSADIKGMFYNIRIPESDRDYMRFLWFQDGDPTREIVEYRLTHQVPGLTDSPSNACFALRQLAIKNQNSVSPATCKTIQENFYMDDLCASGSNLSQLKSIATEMPVALNPGNFHITKWVSNHPEIISALPEEDRKSGELHKILGIWWDISTDLLKIKFEAPTQPPSRRGILSYVMSPFDPRGLALPYLLDMKLLVQKLFNGDWTWDNLLSGPLREEWFDWVAELPALQDFSYKRSLIPEPGYRSIHLCTFTDASQRGYAAVSYIVCEYDHKSTTSFALGKIRVAPKQKLITIPRLELLAAVLGSEVATLVRKELGIKFDSIHFWTDSTTVLHWVNNPDLQLKAFVANRVAKVIEQSEGHSWNYVSTKENPADIGSRGLRPSDIEGIKPWLEGPSWLQTGKATWHLGSNHEHPSPTVSDLEIKRINVIEISSSTSVKEPFVTELSPLHNLFKRYSSLESLKTTAAWLLRCRDIWRTKSKSKLTPKNHLTAAETDNALMELVRAAQWTAFPDLMHALTAEPPVSSKQLDPLAKKQQQTLKQLTPFADEHGLLRVGGRLQRAGFSYEKTHPLIIPKRHDLTGLLINHCHQISHHRGYGYVIAKLRERFWIIGGTGTVRHYLSTCVQCRRVSAPCGSQQMAPLPPSRFAIGHPPFTYTAVDYFGPFKVKLTRRVSCKRWGCLMTCLTTRAVHLEVAHHLSTDSFLLAFRRFISRYPSCKELLSDNGTNFVGAETELKSEFVKNVSLEDLARGLRKEDSVDFRWKFNPPAASHQGGVFERMIGLVRSCLRHTLADVSYRTPDDEALLTMLKEIEGILNSRPLLPAGVDPDSYDVITPAQILQPGLPAVPQAVRAFTPGDSIRPGYRATQWHVDQFWIRFSSGYIPMLQKRSKWFYPHRNFRVNDLVLIKDKDTPRYRWQLGLISEVHPNKTDNLVRRVTIRQANGQPLVRDVRSICLLEASPEIKLPDTNDDSNPSDSVQLHSNLTNLLC